MKHTAVFLTGAIESRAVLFPLPRIVGVVNEVRSVQFTRRAVTTTVDDKLVGLSHDLAIIGTVPLFSIEDPNAWIASFFHSDDTDFTRSFNPIQYFEPPYELAGPQAFFVQNQIVTNLGGVWTASMYYTSKKVSKLAWADLLDRTSFNRAP